MTLDARGNVWRAGTVDQLLTALARDALDIIGGSMTRRQDRSFAIARNGVGVTVIRGLS